MRERFPRLDQLAAEAGAVPVTYQSGKTRSVAVRWACNHRLRQAVTCMADNSRHANAWARAIYVAARAWTDRKPYARLCTSALKSSPPGEGD